MDKIINSLVSNYLADYLEINLEKTKTSLLSGTVELSGVKFKKNLFQTLNLPYLELEDGFIGKINAKLSLPRFYLYPINLFVDQIYVKVRPKNVNKISEEEILKTFEIYKKKQLKEFEELMNIKFSYLFEDAQKSDKKTGTYKLIENIINNLHINIKKVVIIFDDCISSPENPFTFGVTLNKLFIESTSRDFTEIKEQDKSLPFKYKKLSISSLNLFLDKIESKNIIKDEKSQDISAYHEINDEKMNKLNDKEKDYLKDSLNFYLYCETEMDEYSKNENAHSYLLRELNLDIKLIINEKIEENKEPQIIAMIETSTISTNITNKQIESIKNSINYISLKDLYQQSTIDNYFKSKEKIDDETVRKYLEDYSLYYKTKYIEIYTNEKENKIYLENIKKIEKNLKIENIKALREMGNDIINNIIEVGKIDKEIKDKNHGWLNYFKSKKNVDIEKLKKEREKKIEEQKKIQEKNSTMNQFKTYVEGIFKNKDNKNSDEDNALFIFHFTMKEFVLRVKEDKIDGIMEMFEMKYDLFQCNIVVKNMSQIIKLSLRDMTFTQNLSENPEFKKILYSKPKIENENIINDNKVNFLLDIEFEHNILLPISPFNFKLHFGKQMYIIIDYYYLYYLYKIFLRHISDINLNNLTSLLNEKISQIVQFGYNNLLENKGKNGDGNNNDKLFNMHIDILLNAPILLFPLNFRDKFNTQIIYASLGQLQLNSELAGEKDKNAEYDKYLVKISKINLKTLKEYKSQELIKSEQGENLIHPSSFNVEINNYIYKIPKLDHKNDKDFSPVLINIVTNKTKFSLSENQIIFLIKYFENYKRIQYEFTKEELENKRKNKLKKKEKKNDDIRKKEIINKKENNIIDNNIEENDNDLDNNNEKVSNEITNIIKLSIQFGEVEMNLVKNLVIDKLLDLYKDIEFISFSFRESNLHFIMKSNNSMKMDISFGHFYLYDNDSNLDKYNNEIKYINPEFKCIIGTSSYDIKDKNNNVKFSEIYNFNVEPNIKESIKIILNMDTETKITNVDISMCKLTISPNFSSLSRIYIFIMKYFDLYNNSMIRIKNEQLLDKMKVEKIEDIKIDDLSAPPPTEINEKAIKKNTKVIKNKEYSVIYVTFQMKGIDTYFPVDPNSKNTSIIFMTLSTPITYTLETEIEYELNSSSEIIKIDYLLKRMQIIININKGSFYIYEFKNDEILLSSINKIYDNIDISLLINSKLDFKDKSNKYHINIQMNKELEISLNINQIIVFLDLYNQLFWFLDEINKEEYNKINDDDFNIIMDNEDIRRSKVNELMEIKEKNEENRKINKEKNKIINIHDFNNKFTYDITRVNVYMKFYDIIDGVYQSLFEFSMKDINIDLYQNNNPKDSRNLMKYLISTFVNEPKKLNTYDPNNFYIYFDVVSNVEIKSLNSYLNQWEYFVEPFLVKLSYCQFLKRMRPNIELNIENILNVNLSLNFAKIIQFTLKKFSMNREENKRHKEIKLFKNELISEKQDYAGHETPILILENYTGIDMEIWFDNINRNDEANKDFIIKLKDKQKFELSKNLLLEFNVKKKENNLNSTLSYKFCIDDDELLKNANVNKRKLVGNYFNLNYHHIDIHDISEKVKIRIESCTDNLLCRHILFNTLLSVKNETMFKEIQLCNNDNTQKINLINNQRQNVPLPWILSNKNINLLYNNESLILMENISEINKINKFIKLNDGSIIMIDIIKYKINLDEYYANKNPETKKDIYRVDIILSPPISLINNTPYDFMVNYIEKILSTKSLNIYYNFKFIPKNKKNSEKEMILQIIKNNLIQIIYNNMILSANRYIEELDEDDDDKNVEGKSVNKFTSYQKNLSILFKDDDNKTYLISRLFYINPYESISYNNKIYESMKIELNSFKYEIIFDYYFVNRTNLNLYFNNKKLKDILNINNYNILIPPKQFVPVSKLFLDKNVKLRRNNSKYWSDKFEPSALGDDFILNVKDQNDTYNSIEVKIRISRMFNKSITFLIEDKYVIINDLPFDINIKEDLSSIIINIKSNENKVLVLNEESLKKKNNYRVGIDNCYSHLFDINKLGSYDFLIKYDQEIFEKNNIDVEDKLVELSNKKYFPIRCIINTVNKNSIYILFSYSKDFINQLKNFTPQKIDIVINQGKQSKYSIKPEKTVPLIYFDDNGRYESFEKVEIIFDKNTRTIVTLNELSTQVIGNDKKFIIKVQPENNNSSKCITIYTIADMRLKEEHDMNKKIKKYSNVSGIKIKLELKGLGLSIIDETPKEIFYISLYEMNLDYKFSKITNILKEIQINDTTKFSLKNLQLDYCLDNAYDIVFNPTNQILPPKPYDKEIKREKNFIDKVFEDDDDNTPFIQFLISQKIREDNNNGKNKLIYSVYPVAEVMIQEFDIRINTILINSLTKLVNEYVKIFLPSDEEINEVDKDNNENEIKDPNLLIERYDNNYYLNLKDKLLNKEGKSTNLVINNLTLSAIKVNTTFKVNKNAIDIRYIPEFIITLINTICSTFTSFSDVTLNLNEISFTNVFSDFDSLYNKLMSYYKNQILSQIYKIIFNIDILGNPINLLEGVGTGIFQLFNEPRKGLLKGPEEFGIGLTKGARGFVSNVVGGSLKSVSKITGTLLNATKNLSSIGTEEEIVVKEEEKPKGLFKGTLSGLKKGFGELAQGVTGIVTKPIEQSQKAGVGGFFKGLGSGLVGAVLAPVNSVLTVGNEVTSGISNSKLISNKKSLRRFRLPRTLYKYLPISPYDEIKELKRKEQRKNLNESKNIIISLSNEKLYLENSTQIIMLEKVKNGHNFLLTNVMIKVMNSECTKFINKIYICNINLIKENNTTDIDLIMKDKTIKKICFYDEKSKKKFINEINKYLN